MDSEGATDIQVGPEPLGSHHENDGFTGKARKEVKGLSTDMDIF